MTEGLAGKLVVITGASGGIGLECARQFRAAGAKLLLIDLRAEAVEAQKQALGGGNDVIAVASDLSSPEACAEALAACEGPIHALVHLAGIFRPDQLVPADRENVFEPVIAANLTNAYDMAIACLPRLDPNGNGSFVFTSSLAYRRGTPFHTAYSAAKAALVGLTRSLALRLAPSVRVNCVAPGLIETPMATAMPPEQRKVREARIGEIPLARFGEPSEVASVIRFLCGDDSSYVTGQCINIDGGMINS